MQSAKVNSNPIDNFLQTGIFDTERELWSQQKQFMLRNLRHFNFGRRSATLENESAFQIAQHFDIIRNGPKYAHEHV